MDQVVGLSDHQHFIVPVVEVICAKWTLNKLEILCFCLQLKILGLKVGSVKLGRSEHPYDLSERGVVGVGFAIVAAGEGLQEWMHYGMF